LACFTVEARLISRALSEGRKLRCYELGCRMHCWPDGNVRVRRCPIKVMAATTVHVITACIPPDQNSACRALARVLAAEFKEGNISLVGKPILV